jgi:hypothetical protein
VPRGGPFLFIAKERDDKTGVRIAVRFCFKPGSAGPGSAVALKPGSQVRLTKEWAVA